MNDPRIAQRLRKAYTLAREIGLSDGERVEFASTLLLRDVRSWKDLTDAQVQRLLDAMTGYHMLSWLVQDHAKVSDV